MNKPVDQDNNAAKQYPYRGDHPDHPCDLAFQPGLTPFHRLQNSTDLSHLGMAAGRSDLHKSLTLNNHGSGVHEGLVITTGFRYSRITGEITGSRYFSYRNGFSGQERLINCDMTCCKKNPVSRNTVSFGKDQEVTDHNLPSCNTFLLTTSDNQSTGAGEIFQRFQCSFGLLLLVYRDADDDKHKSK